MQIVQQALGIFVLIGMGVLISNNRKRIPWRLVVIGLSLDFLLGLCLYKAPGISYVVEEIAMGVTKILDISTAGLVAVLGKTLTFGQFVDPSHALDPTAAVPQQFIFAIRVGFSIIFVCVLSALGYYTRILPLVVKGFARVLSKTLGLGGPESLSAASAAFVGQVECQLLIKPYLTRLTGSGLFTSVTTAMSTIAGSALLAYISIGMPGRPLMIASLMSVLGGIVMSKIVYPEAEPEKVIHEADLEVPAESNSFYDSVQHGIDSGFAIAKNVVIWLAIMVAMITLVNAGFGALSGAFGWHVQVQDILGTFYMPVAWLLGVPWHDCFHVGRLMATELFLSEFVSYGELVPVLGGHGAYVLSANTALITMTALCGFANLSSMGMNVGGIGRMAPSRSDELKKMIFKSMMVANMATWMSAIFVGIINR